MSSITIKNNGPVDQLVIPIDPEGGVVVLRGANGRGKSESVKAVQSLLAGQGSLNKRRGADGAAEVAGLGATVTLTNRTSHKGELLVDHIEDRLSIAELVDPKLDNPIVADAKRIKAILSIMKVSADFGIFKPLLPENMMVEETSRTTREEKWSSIIELAGAVKADLQSSARAAESQAQVARGAGAALREAIKGIDFDGQGNEEILRKNYSKAIDFRASKRAEYQSAQQQIAARQKAEAEMDRVIDSYDGPSVDEAVAESEEAAKAAAQLTAETAEAMKAYEATKALAQKANDHATQMLKRAEAAQQHNRTIAACREVLASNAPVEISVDVLAAADEQVKGAEAAMENGVRIRDARTKRNRADQYEGEEVLENQKAKLLREAAGKVDGILSASVSIPGLIVQEGRLWSEEHKAFFGELSEGQRISITLAIVLPVVGEGGVLPLPQSAWQDLDPTNRKLIHEMARKRKVTVITAEVADGDLRVENFNPKK